MAAAIVTPERLRELLNYDPLTGLFTWRVRRNAHGGPVNPGDVAGCKSRKRIIIGIDGRIYRAHRLAFVFMTGDWPAKEVDHLDGNPENNMWENLRDATHNTNMQNLRRAREDSKSGILGASPKRKKWVAQISIGGMQTNLGVFSSPEEAGARYLQAKRLNHGGCTI